MKNNLLKKLLVCLTAGVITVAVLLLLGDSGSISWFPPVVVFSLAALALLAAIIFPFIWHYREKSISINSAKVYTYLYNIIRACVAFDVISFAWKKFFGMQFIVSLAISGKPMIEQTGETLTWYYFGFSHTFSLIVAGIQLAGATMLLFRRTLLLGTVILFPLMMNIALIDIFYHMNAGATTQAVSVTLGVTFLLLLHYNKLLAFFIKQHQTVLNATETSYRTKNIIRISVVVFALIFTCYLKFR